MTAAIWQANFSNWTPVAVADATNFTNAGYCALQGGSGTQSTELIAYHLNGLGSASAQNVMVLARDSTVGVTALTGGTQSAKNPASAALAAPPVQFNSSTTKPQRSATLYLATPAFNPLGGVVIVRTPIGEGIMLLGNTASFGEISLSSVSGVGALSSMFEFQVA